ncbi:hypothetical protein CDEST_10044 [Colletotrichum destructivum]|uniref:Uncharacterized protein n=1 Tax=Colletotrichum destructivum TaxID=34406 RepID=A0AAX4ING4_9PEZI|nr:hypothetical protein CDEST_10044 [Colletotrichum destructivum]
MFGSVRLFPTLAQKEATSQSLSPANAPLLDCSKATWARLPSFHGGDVQEKAGSLGTLEDGIRRLPPVSPVPNLSGPETLVVA